MNKATAIYEEAQAAAKKSAALTPYIRGEQGDTLRLEDPELWMNLFSLRSTYDTLARLLTERARIAEAAAKKRAQEPRPVFSAPL